MSELEHLRACLSAREEAIATLTLQADLLRVRIAELAENVKREPVPA